MDTTTMLIIIIISGILSFITLYFIIKSAVKNAIAEAMQNMGQVPNMTTGIRVSPEKEAAKNSLNKLYNSGEITLEYYEKRWMELENS